MRKLSRTVYMCLGLAIISLAGCGTLRRAGTINIWPLKDRVPAGPKAVPERPTAAATAAPTVGVDAASTKPMGAAALERGPVVTMGPGLSSVTKMYPCEECPVVSLEKSMPKEVEAGKAFEYSLRVTNMTDVTLVEVVLTEDIPDGFQYTSANPTAEVNGNKLVWHIASLRPKASKEVVVSGVATDITELQYCTTVATPVVPLCTRVPVVRPRLQLAMTVAEGALFCDVVPVRFVISNVGTGAAQNVRIVNTLPQGLTTVDGQSEVVIDAGTLAPGQSREYTANLRAGKAGTYVTKAIATTSDGLKIETDAMTTVVGQPILAINQTGPEKQYLGRPVVYDVTVTNASDTPAKDAVIENEIPTGVTEMRTTAGAKLVGSKIIWALGALPPNATKTVQVSFTPVRAGVLTNKVTASAHCADSVTATVKTNIEAIPAIMLEVIDVQDPVEVGEHTTYVITVTNQGTAPSTNINVTCTIEDNMQYVSSTGATSASISNGTVTFAPLERLSPKAKATWQVTVTALKPGDVRFKVTMTNDELTRPVEETEATRVYE